MRGQAFPTHQLSGRLVYNSTLMPKEEVFGFNVLNYLEVAEMLQLLLGLLGGFQNKYRINIKKKAYFPQRVSLPTWVEKISELKTCFFTDY